MRAQLEVSQVRQDADTRMKEKDEEIEASKCHHQKLLDSMGDAIEVETKSKSEALRLKKKLETDLQQLEISLDHASRANSDMQNNLKKSNAQVKIQFRKIPRMQIKYCNG